MRYWQYLPEKPLTLKEMHQTISLLKAAWTVLMRTIKLNSHWVIKLATLQKLKLMMDGYKNGISVEWFSY